MEGIHCEVGPNRAGSTTLTSEVPSPSEVEMSYAAEIQQTESARDRRITISVIPFILRVRDLPPRIPIHQLLWRDRRRAHPTS